MSFPLSSSVLRSTVHVINVVCNVKAVQKVMQYVISSLEGIRIMSIRYSRGKMYAILLSFTTSPSPGQLHV